MIPVPQGAKTSDVSPDYATDRLIISPDKLLFMFITPDESIHKSLHVTYSVIQNKKKQQKKNKSPDVNLSDLKLFIYINLRITKPLKRRFLRTLSFFSFFFNRHTTISVSTSHVSLSAAAEKWSQSFQPLLKNSMSHQLDQVLLPCCVMWEYSDEELQQTACQVFSWVLTFPLCSSCSLLYSLC